jgi:hypothetical protein
VFDVNFTNQLFENLVSRPGLNQSTSDPSDVTDFDTVEQERIVSSLDMSTVDSSVYTSVGNQLITEGRVGVVILAGG